MLTPHPTRSLKSNLTLSEFLANGKSFKNPHVYLSKGEFKFGGKHTIDPENIRTEIFIGEQKFIQKNNYARLYDVENNLSCYYLPD
jgi:hypothetical protein